MSIVLRQGKSNANSAVWLGRNETELLRDLQCRLASEYEVHRDSEAPVLKPLGTENTEILRGRYRALRGNLHNKRRSMAC